MWFRHATVLVFMFSQLPRSNIKNSVLQVATVTNSWCCWYLVLPWCSGTSFLGSFVSHLIHMQVMKWNATTIETNQTITLRKEQFIKSIICYLKKIISVILNKNIVSFFYIYMLQYFHRSILIFSGDQSNVKQLAINTLKPNT